MQLVNINGSQIMLHCTYPNLIMSEPTNRACTVHFASLQALCFSSLARTAPGCTSSFCLQSTPPEYLLIFQNIKCFKIMQTSGTLWLCSVYVAVLMNYLESHSFRAFVVRKRSSLLVPDATASCSHLATSFILFPENDFEIIIRVELTFKSYPPFIAGSTISIICT